MKILLDTHILIWVLENNKSLTPFHKSILADAHNEKIVSQLSFIEIAIKINIGKLPGFNTSLHDFIYHVKNDGFSILPIANKHLITYTSLPFIGNHKDTFDRMLIATAINENMAIITVDDKFKLYQSLIRLL
ncbi:MAG: type II toxin-antitoxin system VapC family toxin [Parafilimonas sp.]